MRCCILLLNILDQYLAEIVKRYEKGDLYLSDNVQGVVEVVNEMDSDSSELDEDIAVLKAILRLTATLLQYSFCKEWYSSVEVTVDFYCLQLCFDLRVLSIEYV